MPPSTWSGYAGNAPPIPVIRRTRINCAGGHLRYNRRPATRAAARILTSAVTPMLSANVSSPRFRTSVSTAQLSIVNVAVSIRSFAVSRSSSPATRSSHSCPDTRIPILSSVTGSPSAEAFATVRRHHSIEPSNIGTNAPRKSVHVPPTPRIGSRPSRVQTACPALSPSPRHPGDAPDDRAIRTHEPPRRRSPPDSERSGGRSRWPADPAMSCVGSPAFPRAGCSENPSRP